MSARITALAALLTLSLAPLTTRATPTLSPERRPSAEPTAASRWQLGATLHFAPLESFPRLGVGLHGFYRVSERWSLGGEASFYAPRQNSYIRRFAFSTNLQARLTFIAVEPFRWYGLAGIGLGIFRDSYAPRSPFDDQTSVGVGLQLGTGFELALPASFTAFLEPRAVSYRTRSAADDEWLELGIGLRWRP